MSVFFTSNVSAATFLESGGVVVIEAESSPATGQWAKASKIGGAKGGSYLIWNGPDLFSGRNAGRDTLRYTFRVQKAGNYELRWRSYIGHGNNATEANDSWVRFPTGKNIGGQHPISGWTKVFQNQAKQWSWSAKTVDHVGKSVRQYFSKGDHVIEISGRSHGHAIDRIVLFQYGSIRYSQNTFDGYRASSTVGGSQPPAPEPAPAPVAKPEPTPAPEPAPVAKPEPAPEPKPEPEPEPEPEPAPAPAPAPVVVADDPAPAQPEQSDQVEAPVLSANGATLNWNAVDAKSINIHRDGGEWIESISGSATSWTATSSGQYFVVATNNSDWRNWGRSNTVAVDVQSSSTAATSAAPSGAQTTGRAIDRFESAVYSRKSAEVFWSADSAPEGVQFEVQRDGQVVFQGSASSFYDNSHAEGTTYNYRLIAMLNGEAIDQRELSLTTRGDGAQASTASADDAGQDDGVNLRGTVYSRTALELSWDRSTAADAAAYLYNVYQDGQLIASSDGLSYFADGLNAGQTYRFALRVQDANGVEGKEHTIELTTRGGENGAYLVSRTSTNACDTCSSFGLQVQNANGSVTTASDLFADLEMLGHATVNIDAAGMNIAHSNDGGSIYVAANMGESVVSVELDSVSGEVLNTSIVD